MRLITSKFTPLLTVFALVALVSIVNAQTSKSVLVFEGHPIVKIEQDGVTRSETKVAPGKAREEFKVVISRIEDEYFWTSRNNIRLVAIDGGGAFITFVAANGAGYIRIVKPEMKQAIEIINPFDYVEHLTLGMASVTYYGGK